LKNSGTTADLAVIDEKNRCIILGTEKKKEYKQE
jgi:hypothetical protein